MEILGPIVLPADVVLAPVEELPEATRARLNCVPGDYALTRPRSRTPSNIVNARTAGLLEHFRSPSTIVDAVVHYSLAAQLDPRETLDSAFAVIQRFFNAGLLLAADSQLAKPIDATYAVGDAIASFSIVEVTHVLLDTEVYLARTPAHTFAAIKMARPGAERLVNARLVNEAAILGRLDGRVSPRLLERGEHDGRLFVAMSWSAGVDAHEAAISARAQGDSGRPELLGLVNRIVEAYARLHDLGVLQGDVHPRNVLVDRRFDVTLIDFGFATGVTPEAEATEAARGVVDLFMEPELAQARLAAGARVPASAGGEQYSVAALAYLLLTGAHTHRFVLEPEEMLRQIASEPVLAFAEHGVTDLPHVERVIGRALAKEPEDRFSTMAEFAQALRIATASDEKAGMAARDSRCEPRRQACRFVDDVLDRLALSGPLLRATREAPTASFSFGAAGLAYALLRIARTRDDEQLLALADVWSTRALRDVAASRSEAFYSAELEITPATVGGSSLHHTAAGVHCVDALIAHARCDQSSLDTSLAAFMASSRQQASHLDVSFGTAGSLLGCAILHDTMARQSTPQLVALRAVGQHLSDQLCEAFEGPEPLERAMGVESFGAAHGWAGILYAVLRWSQSLGERLPHSVQGRLDELAAKRIPLGRGYCWPWPGRRDTGLHASWCNGAAGFVSLWTLAHQTLGDGRYLDLAIGAAWVSFEAPHTSGNVCCGLSGRAYSLLNLYKLTGERTWLDRARTLAEGAAVAIRQHALRRDSLFRGETGVALLLTDLERPELARMPLYEGEGW